MGQSSSLLTVKLPEMSSSSRAARNGPLFRTHYAPGQAFVYAWCGDPCPRYHRSYGCGHIYEAPRSLKTGQVPRIFVESRPWARNYGRSLGGSSSDVETTACIPSWRRRRQCILFWIEDKAKTTYFKTLNCIH